MPVRDEFLSHVEKAINDIAASEGIATVTTFDANNDMNTQLSQVQTCASGDYDGIFCLLVQNDSAQEVLNAAGKLPVTFVNRMPTDLSILDGKTCAYVGANEADLGYAEGEILADKLIADGQKEANLVLFRGVLGLDSVRLRSEGVTKALEDKGVTTKVVFDDTAEWDRAKAMEKMTQFLGSGTEFNCVASNNDEMALGVVEAYKAAKKDVDVPIVGIDATSNGCQGVSEGTLVGTVDQNSKGQGEDAYKTMISLLKGEEPAKIKDGVVYNEAAKVTADNVADFM